MKKILGVAIALVLVAGTAFAAKTTYIVNNGRMNWVKIKEVGASRAASLNLSHPATLSEAGVRAALASINLSRTYVIKKEVDEQRVFDDRTIDYLAPALVKAFSEATGNEIVVFSYLSKNPIFILRNDRLNICDAWVSEGELHIRFQKLYAKISGDTDKRGNEARLVSQARGLRVKLELGPGQKLGVDDTDEIVLGLDTNYVKAPEVVKPVTEGTTLTGKMIPLAGVPETGAAETPGATAPTAAELKAAKKQAAKAAKAQEGTLAAQAAAPAPAAMTPAPAATAKTPAERLKQLEQLRKEGLVNQKEFDAKKQEILNQL